MAENKGPFEQLGETLGETAGRVAGRATDMTMNVAGSIFGNAMDALGDWWRSADAQRAGGTFGEQEDTRARVHFEASAGSGGGKAEGSYDEVRPLYQLGHVAAHNPEYEGRSFRDVEPTLERAWRDDTASRYGDWGRVRGYVGHGYEERARRLRESREAGMRAQGGGSSDEREIRREGGDGLMP
jgi:hypothetical protein